MRSKARFIAMVASAAGLLAAGAAQAVNVTSTFTDLGAGKGAYEYSVQNNDIPSGFVGFTVYFAPGRYSGLSAIGPTNWDPITADPDGGIPADGFADWLDSTGAGIASGDSLSGFRVEFDLLQSGAPESQDFDVYVFGADDDFELLGSGRTSIPGSVPEPGTLALFSLGLLGLAVRRRPLRS
jgi:hypothetical protein